MLRRARPRQASGKFARDPWITERDAYELGFKDGFQRNPGHLRLRLRDRHGELYDRGFALGKQVQCTPAQAAAAAPEARRRAEQVSALPNERPVPCASCQWIGLCAIEGRTCPVFRGWVSGGSDRGKQQRERQAAKAGRGYSPRMMARVPDRTWDRSFNDD